MTDTIKARDGYHVRRVINAETGETGYLVCDGKQKLFVAQMRTEAELKDELEDNECAYIVEVFTTKSGNQFAYWIDTELLDAGLPKGDYITLLRKAVPDA